MIVRIVKMIFKEEKLEEFFEYLKKNQHRIKAFEGCEMVEILQDKKNPAIVLTHSHWKDESYLEKYRVSEVFKEIWGNTKIHFAEKPEAWTLESLERLS